MTNGKSKQKAVDPALVRAIKDLMVEVTRKPKEGERSAYSLSEKCKILDRMIKIESMRLGVAEDDSGSFFRNKDGQNDDNDSETVQ